MIKLKVEENSIYKDPKWKDYLEFIMLQLAKAQNGLAKEHDMVLSFAKEVSLSYLDPHNKVKPLVLDLLSKPLLQRIARGFRHEYLVKACFGSLKHLTIIDNSAGLGRDSMILQSAGARVLMFERNIVIFAMLFDAFLRAKTNSLNKQIPNGIPYSLSFGSFNNYINFDGLSFDNEEIDCIYYDPMFPERKKSAEVKKEMKYFQDVIGEDEDIEEYLIKATLRAKRRVVLKRPCTASLIESKDLVLLDSIDAKALRFDIYKGRA